MDNLNDEKYISIDYRTWNEKYKPMEEENRRLQFEVDESRIKVQIVFGLDSFFDRYEGNRYIGSVEIENRVGAKVNIDNWQVVNDYILSELRGRMGGRSWITKSEATEMVKQMTDTQERNERLVKSIPWLIRSLFGIKSI